MNDPGPIPGPGGTMITDPLYTPGYSQFCYELPFMPGTTQYLDTPGRADVCLCRRGLQQRRLRLSGL